MTREVTDPMIRAFPLPTKHKDRLEVGKLAILAPCTHIKSILLSFSLRVAGGVLRRKKSKTRLAVRAHMGRLRSRCFIHDTDRTIDRIQPTKYPSPTGDVAKIDEVL
jgi:hypothetical protein